jgi:alpha-N-arabinofuranosidase
VCLAIRPHGKSRFPKVHGLGRETFLAPVAWTPDGWPVVNTTGTLDLEVAAPALAPHPWPPAPARDDFDAPVLAFHWQHLRNPRPEYYSLTRRPGWLALACGAGTLDEPASPACVLRRQTAHGFRMETLLDFIPAREGEEAGMTVFMNNHHHYDFFVAGGTGGDGGRRLALRLRVGDMTVERGSLPLPGDAPVRLRIESVPDGYRFLLVGDGNAGGGEVLLGAAQSRYLSTEVAGGFTGMMIGLYATCRGQCARPPATAFFDWAEVEAKN